MAGTLYSAEPKLLWKQLPSLPDPIGFAGAYAGTSGGALIVAGGANFPAGMPWDGGRKTWYDTVFLLNRADSQWQVAAKLPRPLGYGVSVTTPEGIVCIGGSNSDQHFRDVFLLTWRNQTLKCTSLPPLPQPLANSCGAVIGHTIYVAGGTTTPDATNALRNFWSLDLARNKATWQELPSWPGPARMLPVAAAVGGNFFLCGGTDLAPGADGNTVRTYLKDTYRFTPGKGWNRVADMPNPVAAAPTPAPVPREDTFLVVGGDDGSLVDFEPKSKHPGFSRKVLACDTRRNRWTVVGETPASRATLPAATWNNMFVLPSGESRPGVRSPQVWTLEVSEPR